MPHPKFKYLSGGKRILIIRRSLRGWGGSGSIDPICSFDSEIIMLFPYQRSPPPPSLDWYFLIQFSVLLMWLAYYSDLKIQKWANLDKLYRWVLGFFYFWAIFGVNFDPLMVSRLWMGQFLLKYDMLYHFGNGRTTARHMCWFWNNISTLMWFFRAKYTF